MPRPRAPIAALALLQLTVTSRGGKTTIKPIGRSVNGTVIGAEVADLNSNSLPELDVDGQSAGSGSDGELVGDSVVNGDQLSPIDLLELKNGGASWIRRPTSVLQF
ncbi:MAG: hypothetical protein VKO65_05125 [Cyanobacteriota bacterium]|nr:hypothetical protein [Cyanobacteriota bacterium]